MPANEARFWDRAARKYAAAPISDTAGYERTLTCTREYLKPGDHALEFGCGTGTTALKLAPSVARYVATDISPEMIAIAREKAGKEGVDNAERHAFDAGVADREIPACALGHRAPIFIGRDLDAPHAVGFGALRGLAGWHDRPFIGSVGPWAQSYI